MFVKRQLSPIGLEIGPHAIRAVQLQKSSCGWTVLDAVTWERFPDGAAPGKSRLENTIARIRDGIKSSVLAGKWVVSALPSDLLDILPIKLSLEGNESLEEAVVRESRAYLSYDLEEAVLDYLPLERRRAQQESEGTGPRKVLLVAARREHVDEHLALLRSAKLRPVAVEIPACALARVFGTSRDGHDKNKLVMNMGEKASSLTILWGEQILLERTLDWGLETLARRLQDQLKLDHDKSRDLLNRVGLSAYEEGQSSEAKAETSSGKRLSKTVSEIVNPALVQLAREIEKVFLYFSSEMRGASLHELTLLGLANMVKDLDTFLQQRIGIPVQLFDPMRSLGVAGNSVGKSTNGDGPNFSVALGLALRGHSEPLWKRILL
jgi:type IV pilus assembly protein PilM